MMERVHLFGLAFHNFTQAEFIDRIAEAISERRPRWIATVNVHFLCLAARDRGYEGILRSADVVTADGMPIVWMSRLRRRPLRARVTGSDLLVPLADRASREGWRVFLCGGAPGACEEVAQMLRMRLPALDIAGTSSPTFRTEADLVDPDANAELLARIQAARPHVLLVAFGAPKQERWIYHHISTGLLDVPVSVGVGASFDFLAGRKGRAPRWMRRIGLEWFHRMCTEPARLGPRYGRDAFTFARLCLAEIARGSSRGPS